MWYRNRGGNKALAWRKIDRCCKSRKRLNRGGSIQINFEEFGRHSIVDREKWGDGKIEDAIKNIDCGKQSQNVTNRKK